MTSYVTPKKNAAYVFGVSLYSQASPGIFQSNPTLAAGDVKISKDGGAFANVTNLPTVNPASGKRVEVSLTSTEMNADNITVIFSDAAGSEWYDLSAHIQTSARQIDDLAYPATSGRSMVIDASGLVDANAVKLGPSGSGTAQTARDIGASVLLSSGTGTGQLDFTSGVVKSNLVQILGTALTETSGQIAAGFKKLFDVASPVFTLLSVNQTGDSYARLGAPAGASVSADIAAAKTVVDAIKVKTDSLTFTVAGMIDANVIDWKGSTAPAMTGDAYARLGAPAGASVSADVAAVKVDTAAIKAKTDNLPSDPADESLIIAATDAIAASIAALPSAPTADENADALLDRANAVETSLTVRGALRIMAAVLAGKVSGAGSGTETFRNVGDSMDRVVSTNDTDGNRTAVTVDAS